ncbi:MAG: DMT family transporter, partial [Synergistaceae bacterium]|nr:DMT family transporter [Synergistaceae bacterium]
MGKQLRGMTMLSLAAFIWGTAFVAQRMGMDHVGPATFMAVRFLVGGASLVPVIIINSIISGRLGRKPESGDAPSRLLWRAGVYCGIVIFVCGILQQVGILYTTVGKSGFITTLYIVIVPILGLFLGRGVSPSVWGCICIAAVGMYMLCVKESASINRGDVYTLFCALFYSVHILLVDHYSPKVDA